MSQPDYTCEYPGLVQTDETCFRFTDKSIQASERVLYSNYWREQINQFGVKVDYYVNTYNTLSADNFYGEQPTKTFVSPRKIILAVTLNENAITLSRFGFESDDEVTAYVHISSFKTEFESLSDVYDRYTQFGPIVEPKAGDVFELSEYGDDRPNNRQGKFFEITEKLDQDIAQMNNLQGHYVFLIKAKRLDYSFEPGIIFNDNISENGIYDADITINSGDSVLATESLLTLQAGLSGVVAGQFTNDQVYEDGFAGRLKGGTNTGSLPKREDYNEYIVDDVSKEDVFDMSNNETDVYGDYY